MSNKTKTILSRTQSLFWWQSILADFGIALPIILGIIFSPLSSLIGSGKVDVWNHVWGSWWWFDSLSNGIAPWQTTLLQYPDGGTLWFIDPVLAVLGLPFAGFSPALAYNFGIWIYLAFASWTARRFAIALGAAPNAS